MSPFAAAGMESFADCWRLRGTKEAMPKLIEAIDNGNFLPPTSREPYHLQWLAALAIAQRDPWPEVDDWLAGLIPAHGSADRGS